MAAARAAARRQAILNSRGDRLAKLTSSARGDDPGGVYTHDDPPVPTLGSGPNNFVGDESTLPPLAASTSRTQLKAASGTIVNVDTTAQTPEWDPAQQQELFRALMSGAGVGQPGLQTPPVTANSSADPSALPATEDPISTLLASLGGGGGAFAPAEAVPSRPRTLAQKLIPVLHVLSMLAILVWFVGWREPDEFKVSWLASSVKPEETGQEVLVGYNWKGFGWRRWARLARGSPTITGLLVPPVPAFFWSFTTLQIALHSLRLFSEPGDYRPPMLLGLILPYLPKPLPQVILTSLKYLQMGSMVLDDLSILVFGIGLVVLVSSWRT